ncbi:MAG: hypothetical protein JWR16_548 [Nevskia sp.]|nr:hypothetical protein [Nevskia sp.]
MSAPLILTATDRLARALREDESLARRAEGRSVWEASRVRSLRQWLQDAWADSWPSAQLLNSTQTLALWLQTVERDRRGVIGALGCAREAQASEKLALDYALDLSALPAYSEEHQAWRAWQARIQQRLRTHDWITADHLPQIVARGLRDGSIAAPEHVQLAGFERAPPPAMRNVLDALAVRSSLSRSEAPRPANRTLQGWRSADAETQCRAIAETVRLKLAPYADRDEPPPRIVIVMPDADARRALLEDALTALVAPWLRLPHESTAQPWRWDRGRSLAEQPCNEAASALLALDAHGNEPVAVSRFLLAPLLWPAALRASAAALDARLRERPLPRYSLSRLAALAPAALQGSLQALSDLLAAAPSRALPSAWSAHFLERLQLLHWPAAPELPSSVFQNVRELRRELSRLAALDAQTGAIDAARARLWLNELLKRRFEARAEHTQPVLIAAAEDAVGLSCELLIVADADASAFPGAARSSPFLPIEAQRAAGIPQAAPQTWLADRQALVDALLAQADEVLVLAARVDERGGEVLPAPLFAVDWQDAPAARARSVAERLAQQPAPVVLPAADPVPAVLPSEDLRGDASLFKLFAEAPFFAYCTHRLGIKPLREPPRGLDAAVQGELLHDALDKLWQRLLDSNALASLDAEAVSDLIERTLAPLIQKTLPESDYGSSLVRLEAARLADILRQWFAHERRRIDPFAVVAREQRLEGTLGGLRLRLRVDRIDEVQSSVGPRTLILDYKTGREADPKGWDADSLKEPQLPLYAILLRQQAVEGLRHADGIAFAHLKDGHPALSANTNWALRLIEATPRDGDDWPAQLAAWNAQLESYARAFLAGVADLDPDSINNRSPNKDLMLLAGVEPDDAEAGDAESGE